MTQVLPKKISSYQFSWYVVLVCGMIIPIITSAVLGVIIDALFKSFNDGTSLIIVTSIIGLFVLWFAIKYYSSYANKKYEISDKNKLLKDITTTYIAWSCLGLIIYFLGEKPNITNLAITIMIAIIEVIVVYLASKKFFNLN